MPNKAIDAQIFCPFYISEAAMSITCEGIIGSSTVSRFNNEYDKLYHETNFCTGKTCSGCGVFSALMQNYTPTRRKRPELRH
ncbi:MAG: hypothetical protein E7647_03840 [Ruminococcaceae bacterium]|nr:hypothetical protein [Oscillospiraceae bacterium]